jgi:hypothetical protein
MMKKILLLLASLTFFVIASADQSQRGVTFEKDGLIYTIASEYIIKKHNIGRSANDPAYLIQNEGEVYVSGVSGTKSCITIPTRVTNKSHYCRKDSAVTATYNVLGIGARAFEDAKLDKLIIPFGLLFYGEQAFHNLELKSGVLVLPPAKRMRKGMFDGVKAKVLLTNLTYSSTTPIFFDKTFDSKEEQPDIYIYHGIYSTQAEGIDKKSLCTIGKNIYNKWIAMNGEFGKDYIESNVKFRISSIHSTKDNSFNTLYSSGVYNENKIPTITIKKCKKFEKTKTDIDMIAPCEYQFWNPYTYEKGVYDEFIMNESLFRLKKGTDYKYYTLDGKPITNTESLIDNDGKDPFGLQVHTPEEVKEKRAAKEREENINRKMKDLKKVFGF